MKIRVDKNFVSAFDEKSGKYIRTGILRGKKDTGVDPFMASFPELLDVGIMGHCIHGRTGLCVKAGIECYQDGLHRMEPNMSLEDFESIVDQCRGRTFQIALGGCGDPDQHEHFPEILRLCREAGIVPNFTTSGFGMTREAARLCREYCGAVAVSWYRCQYTLDAIDMLMEEGVKTNIHYVLNTDTLEEAVRRLEEDDFPDGINAVVFLLHKPVGLGTREKVIPWDSPDFRRFMQTVHEAETDCKIGFDSCTVPAILNDPGNISIDSVDTCEGARWSAYISPDMKMMPCSFDNQAQRWAVDLRRFSIQEAWDSREFEDFRSRLRNACPGCQMRRLCLGGCPICPEIVLCGKRKRSRVYWM